MITTIIFILFSATTILSQAEDKKTINDLMLESNYSQVVNILGEKQENGEKLSYNESFYLSISYQRLMNHRKAIRTLSFMNKEKPNEIPVLFSLAESYKAMGNNRVTSSIYQQILMKDSANILARIELAKIYLGMKDFQEAKSNFQNLVLSDSTNSYYLQQYGYSLYKLGKDKKAKMYLEKALQIDEYNSKAALWLAKIHFDKEEYNEALEIVKKSAKFNPMDLPLNKLAAEIYFKMKWYKSASAQYLNVIVLGDSSSVIFQKLGLSLYSSVATRDSISEEVKTEKMIEAVEALKSSLAKDEHQNPLTLTYLGFCYKVLGDYKKSIFYLEESLNAMIPEYIDRVYSTLGTSYELSEDYYDAIIAYSNSLEFDDGNPNTIFRLAAVYDRYYEDKTVALAHYEKFLRMKGKKKDMLSKYAEDRIERLKSDIHFRQ